MSRGDEAPGAPVYFGSPVRLQLLRSRAYLTTSEVPSKTNKRVLKLGLSKSITKEAHFRIQPHLKVRREGELVYYEEPTNIQDSNDNWIGTLLGASEDAQPQQAPEQQSAGVFAMEDRTAWKIVRFLPYDAKVCHASGVWHVSCCH